MLPFFPPSPTDHLDQIVFIDIHKCYIHMHTRVQNYSGVANEKLL